MSFVSRTVSVGDSSPTLLSQGRGDRGPQGVSEFSAAAHNLGVGTAYLGGADVSVANGFPFYEGATATLGELGYEDAVYAISASGTIDIRVLELG